MSNQDLKKMQIHILSVNIQCDCFGCNFKIEELLRKIEGVSSISVNAEEGKVTVKGNVDLPKLIKELEKAGKRANLLGPEKDQKTVKSKTGFTKQTFVLRVNGCCDGCKYGIENLLRNIDGVRTCSVNAEKGKVTVTGNVDPAQVIQWLGMAGKHAELWGPENGQKTCVLRVNKCCVGCKFEIENLLRRVKGVRTCSVNAEEGKVTVTGNVDAAKLIEELEKAGKLAELWGLENGQKTVKEEH